MQNPKIEIPLSRRKLVKLICYCIVFIAAGTWLAIYQPQTSNPILNSTLLKYAIGMLGILMGLIGFFAFLMKIFDTKAGITIDQTGVIENASALSVGRIPWADILDIRETTAQGSFSAKEKFIIIMVKNPDYYISKQKNAIRRKLMELNARKSGSPLYITTNGLKIRHAELKELLQQKLKEYRGSGN